MKFFEVVVYFSGLKEYHTFDLCFRNKTELNTYLRSIGIKKSDIVRIKEVGGV